MSLTAQLDAPPFRTDDQGVVRIGETRVSLGDVVEAFREGASAEEILLRYSSLRLPDVYGTIAYYLRHQIEVDAHLRDESSRAEEARREADRLFDTRALRDKLLSRRSEG
jgi:uncharacterized protein (DUF433 family)